MIRPAAFSAALTCAITSALACSDGTGAPVPPPQQQTHSGSLAVSPDGAHLFVVHPDADSLTILNRASRAIEHEVLLSGASPAVASTKRFDPAVGPRAVALDSRGATAYVTGERSGHLYAVDTATAAITGDVFVCSEPVGVVVSHDDANVFVACSQDEEVVEVAAAGLAFVAKATCPRKPWALAWGADGTTLFATHLLGPGVSVFGTAPLALQKTWTVADGPPVADGDPTEPHGQVRGIYDAAIRPGTGELWVAHLMLGTDTPQPTLDFLRTVFPALSIFDGSGTQVARLSVEANTGDGGQFGDIVSGPHALTFSDDGKFAFMVDTDSEDVLVVDTDPKKRNEVQILRPLPGHLPEGIVWSHDEIYVQERNTEDIAAFQVTETDLGDAGTGISVVADGAAFKTLPSDPMPANLRLGQKLFFSSNSDDVPVTQDHWVACATCHIEGRSDAVTWLFAQGPRDTPSNAGGTLDTGFLFRTADRTQVEDYWKTIDIEQGGHFDPTSPAQQPLLQAIANFVNYAMPAPVPPSTDTSHSLDPTALTAIRAQGAAVFDQAGCGACHSGPAKTDSGSGNASLDLGGAVVSTVTTGGVLLHDVGTCATGGTWPDVAHEDIDGHARQACAFDTPALRGLADSAPYLHDGSAATLDSVIPVMVQASAALGAPSTISVTDRAALVEYLRSL